MLAAFTAIVLISALEQPLRYRLLVFAGGVYVIARHRANIRRLLEGTEPRIGQHSREFDNLVRALFQQALRDHLRLNFAGALEDIQDTRIGQHAAEIGYSMAKPLPPWICSALSAAAQATRAASSFAIPASRSQRLP